MSENRLIIYPREYKPRKADIPSQEQVQTTIHDLILRIDTLRDEVLPNLHAALLDPTIHDEERHRRERTIQEIIVRIERADHLVAEMEQYIHKEHASLARLIEDNRFKHLQHLVAIIERAVSEEALPGVLHEAGEHMENSQESPLLPPDSFHPEWYSEADIEQANHLLAVDLEELIGPDIELKAHVDAVVRFLFDPIVIVELKKRMRDKSSLQPASLLFIKEKDPGVWQSLLTLVHSSKGKEVLLHILGKPTGPTPTAGEMEVYTARMYEKLPNVLAIALSYSKKGLVGSEIKSVGQEDQDILKKFYGTNYQSLDKTYQESLLYELWIEEMMQGIEQQKVTALFKLLQYKHIEKLITNPTAVREALNIFQQDVFPKITKEQRKKIFSLCQKVLPELFEYSFELKRIIDKKEKHLLSETIKTKSARFLLPKKYFERGRALEKEKVEEMRQEMFRSLRIVQLLLQNICFILNDFPKGEMGTNFNRFTSAVKGVFGMADYNMHDMTAEDCRLYIMRIRYHSENLTDEQAAVLKNARGFYLADQDLSSRDLRKLNLSDWDFTGANLDRINPEGTCFRNAKGIPAWIEQGLDIESIYRQEILIPKIAKREIKKMSGLRLENASTRYLLGNVAGGKLYSVDLHLALITANLRKAKMKDVNVNDAYITSSDLREATIEGSNLYRAHLCYTRLDNAKIIVDPLEIKYHPNTDIFTHGIDSQSYFRRSLLIENIKKGKGSRFVGIVLRNANFMGMERSDITFENMDIKGSAFSLGKITNSKFAYCKMNNCQFWAVDLKNTQFLNCSLEGASFLNAKNIPPEIAENLDEYGIYRTNITNPETPPPAPPTPAVPQP